MQRNTSAAPEFTARAALDAGGNMPQASYSAAQTGGPQLLSLADNIRGVLASRARRDDQEAQAAAAEAGFNAGSANPGAQMQDGGSLYRAAFNRAAMEAAGRRLEIDARANLDRLAREHEADPGAFTAAYQAYTQGALAPMPQALQDRLRPTLDMLAQPYQRSLATALERRTQDQRIATFNEALPGRIAAIERGAVAGATDPAATGDIVREQLALRQELIALGPRQAFTLNGQEIPADPTRAGALSVTQITERLQGAQETEALGTARGLFAQGPRTEAWVQDFEARGEKGEIPGITPPMARRMAGEFRRDLAQQRSVDTEARNSARAEIATLIDADKRAIADSGKPISGITDEQLARAGYDVPRYRAAEAAQISGWQARQDLLALTSAPDATAIAARFAPGTALFAADPTTAMQVRDIARQRGAQIESAALDRTLADRVTEAVTRTTAAAGPFTLDRAIVMLARHESGNRADIGQHGNGGSAGGLLGITDGLWRDYATRAGVQNLDKNNPEAQKAIARIFLDDQDKWARENLGRGLTYTDARAAWFLGAAGWRGMVQADRSADAFTTYAAAAGPARAAQAFDNPANAALLQRGATVGEVMARLARQAGEFDPRRPEQFSIVSREEAAAAGRTPEWADAKNAEAFDLVRRARFAAMAATASPEERRAVEADLAVLGNQAAENARAMDAWRRALVERETALANDAAGFVVDNSPTLRVLAGEVQAGNVQRLPVLLESIATEQERLGVPPQQRNILPKPFANAVVYGLSQQQNDAARVAQLSAMTATIAAPATRAQLMASLKDAGLPDHLIIGANVARNASAPIAQRITTELAIKERDLPLEPAQRREVISTVNAEFGLSTGWLSSGTDRLGSLRRAQAEATGNAAFATAGEREREILQHIAMVRAGQAGSTSSSAVREAYQQLFGHRQVINRPDAGVLVSASASASADRLTSGLRAVADARLADILAAAPDAPQELRRVLRDRVVWLDEGAGNFALYLRGNPQPIQGRDGQPIVVTEQDALLAGLGPPPARGMFSGQPFTGRTASPNPDDALDSGMRRQLRRNREAAQGRWEDFLRTVPADE
jgi:hypothetical protein